MAPRPAPARARTPAPARAARAALFCILLLCTAAPALSQSTSTKQIENMIRKQLEQLTSRLDQQDRAIANLDRRLDQLPQTAQVARLAGSLAALDGRLDRQQGDLTQILAELRSLAAADNATTPTPATPATPATPTTPTTTPEACVQLAASALGRAACDGPWVVLQTRSVGDVLFDLYWTDYSSGFGHVDGDYWLGLDAIHQLCPPSRPCELRVEITYTGACTNKDWCVPRTPDGRYTSLWHKFAVAGAKDLYRLTVGGFDATVSTAGDALTYMGGMPFSTRDADHDVLHDVNCSAQYGGRGGWWYRNCGAWLNGKWAARRKGLYWYPVTGYDSAASSRMLVRVAA